MLSSFQNYLMNKCELDRIARDNVLYPLLKNFDAPTQLRMWPEDNNSVPIAEIVTLSHDYILARTEHGICFAYNCITKETMIVNKNQQETVRSVFQNTVNDSIFIISVKNRDHLWRMKCRAVSL